MAGYCSKSRDRHRNVSNQADSYRANAPALRYR